MDVVMTGFAGLSGSAELADRHAAALTEKLPAWLLEVPSELMPGIRDPREFSTGITALTPIGEGGVREALWKLADAAQIELGVRTIGLDISLEQIPIRQETIEICEALGEDPYGIPSGGWLYAAEEGWRMPGTVIGHITHTKGRIIRTREGVRYLDKPRRENRVNNEEQIHAK